MEETIPTSPAASPIVPGEADLAPRAQPASARRALAPAALTGGAGLFAYLAAVIAVTSSATRWATASWTLLRPAPTTLPAPGCGRSSPADCSPMARCGLRWLATAVLGVWAIRLAGGRVLWTAAILAHVLGTLLVYAGVWIMDAQDPSAVAALTREADFGVSLVRAQRLACSRPSHGGGRGRCVHAPAGSSSLSPRLPRSSG